MIATCGHPSSRIAGRNGRRPPLSFARSGREMTMAFLPYAPKPGVLWSTGIAGHGPGQFLWRKTVPPDFKLGLFGLFPSRQQRPDLLLVQQYLLLGRHVAFRATVVAILGQGPKSPGTWIRHRLPVLVHQLPMRHNSYSI